jgi:hypothetical protein
MVRVSICCGTRKSIKSETCDTTREGRLGSVESPHWRCWTLRPPNPEPLRPLNKVFEGPRCCPEGLKGSRIEFQRQWLLILPIHCWLCLPSLRKGYSYHLRGGTCSCSSSLGGDSLWMLPCLACSFAHAHCSPTLATSTILQSPSYSTLLSSSRRKPSPEPN